MQHLMFGGYKCFKKLAEIHFHRNKPFLDKNFLSVSLSEHLTYADNVESLLKNFSRGSADDRRLTWLLERGVSFEGSEYISQEKFETEFLKSKKRILNRVKLGEYIKKAEHVKFVFVQSPRGFTADIKLHKGSKKTKEAITVMTKRTNVEEDYPHLTKNLAKLLEKDIYFIANATRYLKLFGDEKYHQSVHTTQCYSNAALDFLRKYSKENPNYTPYK